MRLLSCFNGSVAKLRG